MANSYPDDFSNYFIESPQRIDVVIAGERSGLDVLALVDYDSFRLVEGTNEYLSLAAFLSRSHINRSTVEAIMSDAVVGIGTDPDCSVRYSRCLLTVSGDDQPRYVFNFDESVLKIFVPASSVSGGNDHIEYEAPWSHSSGLINWSNLYGYTEFEGRERFNWSNQTTLGLPLGYLYMDTTLKNDDFTTYAALYDAEWEGVRLQAGRNRYNPSFNTTDYLNTGMTISGYNVFVGSSRNLVRGNVKALQRIHFYAPQQGRVEVYREGRLVLTKVVAEGQQYLSYDELPVGAYQATLLLKVSGEVVLTETRQVVNDQLFSLRPRETDWVGGIGHFNTLDDDYYGLPEGARNYARVMTNTRITEAWMLGGAATGTSDNLYGQVGSQLQLGDLSASYSLGFFSEGESYQTARLSVSRVYAYWRSFDYDTAQPERLSLPHYLYGLQAYKEVGVGGYSGIGSGQGYLRYSYYDMTSPLRDGLADRMTNRYTVSTGYDVPFFGGSLNLYADYHFNNAQDDDYRVMLSWSRDIGRGLSIQTSTYVNQKGFDSNVNYLRAQQDIDEWHLSGAAGARLNRDNTTEASLSASVMGRDSRANYSAYGFVNDAGIRDTSLNISGTQVISSHGLALTPERGRAFVRIKRHYNEVFDTEKPHLQLVVSRDEHYGYRREFEDDDILLKVNEFEYLRVDVDELGSFVDVDNRYFQSFIHPGDVYDFQTTLSPLAYMIVVLDDVYDHPITSLQCLGDDCVAIEALTEDGVFGVKYRQGGQFQLISSKGLCLLDTDDEHRYLKGYCLPGIEEVGEFHWNVAPERIEKSPALLDGHSALMFFLGRFGVGQETEAITLQLKSESIPYKVINVANEVFIYILDQQEFTQAQRSLLEKLDTYVLLKDAKIDLLTNQIKTSHSEPEVY